MLLLVSNTRDNPAETVLVVGIGGGTGSGKTRFARALQAELSPEACTILDHDAYYRDLSHLEHRERTSTDFDDPSSLETELLCQHLDTLRKGRGIEKPLYDFATHCRRADTERLEPRPVVVVEGILVLADARLVKRLDLRLYVEAPADLRLARRFLRDIEERGRTVDFVKRQYETTVRRAHARFVEPSRELADLIVPGTSDFSAALRMTADALRHRLRLT
jgi:uridine kinase